MKTLFLLTFTVVTHFSMGQYIDFQAITNFEPDVTNISTIDIDGDGLLDPLTSSALGLTWYKQLNSGLFDFQQVFTPNAKWFTVADVDQNGLDDIVVYHDNDIIWYENQGNLLNATAHNIGYVGNRPVNNIFVEDMNLDGNMDIVISDYFQLGLSWLENLGGNTFASNQYITTWNASSFALLDIDSDGDLDIYSCNGNQLRYIQNLGSGNFSTIQQIATITENVEMEAFDFDGDLDMDLILADATGIKLKENDNGTLLAETTLFTTSNLIKFELGDLDGDANLDLVVASNSNSISTHEFSGVNFTPLQQISQNTAINPSGLNSLLVEDLNNDGWNDILFTSSLTTFNSFDASGWYENNSGVHGGMVTFSSPLDMVRDSKGVDLDNDGDIDIVSISFNLISWCENIGDSTFITSQTICDMNDTWAYSFCIKDFDNDGDLDIISGSNSDALYYIENIGGATFSPKVLIADNQGPISSIDAGDIDNDGDLDISFKSGNFGSQWMKNTGNGNFNTPLTLESGPTFSRAKLADLNGDGNLDVFSTIYSGDDRFGWRAGSGNGNFGPVTEILFPSVSQSTASDLKYQLIDFDFDNDIDIVASRHQDDSMRIYFNDGFGNFEYTSLPFFNPFFICFDIDNDNDIDFFGQSGSYTTLRWYINDGNLNFSFGGSVTPPLTAYDAYLLDDNVYLDPVDLDNDGDLDLIASITPANEVSYTKNILYSATQIKGRIYFDQNQNAQLDSTDFGLGNIQILSTPQSDYAYTYDDGNYFMHFSDVPGSYEVTVNTPEFWKIVTTPDTLDINITPAFASMDSVNFGLYPDTVAYSISADISGSFPRCNTEANYWIDLTNNGTTILDGYYELILDPELTYVNSSIAPDSIVSQAYYWHFDSLEYFQTEFLNIRVLMPDANSIGNEMVSYVNTFLLDSLGGYFPDDADSLYQTLVCAYDPNDKTVYPKGFETPRYISNDEILEYQIRFQNTGNDTALVIRIKDMLDENLDWNSLEVISHSHSVETTINQDGELTFLFDQIYLPDSNVNYLGSQGFVKYRIRIKENRPAGTEILNTAHIYFDYNPPIITNTTLNTIFLCSLIENTITSNDPVLDAGPIGESYQWVNCSDNSIIPGATSQSFIPFENGEYAVIVTNPFCTDTSICTPVFSVDSENISEIDQISISPNPTKGNIVIQIGDAEVKSYFLYDASGRVINVQSTEGKKQISLDLESTKGIYYLIIETNQKSKTFKIIKL